MNKPSNALRAIRLLVHPVTVIAVALVAAFLTAWAWPKVAEDSSSHAIVHYRGFRMLGGTLFGPRFYRLQVEYCVIDYSRPGYNPFECRYPDGTLHARGTCHVEYSPGNSLTDMPFPEIENVMEGDFYKPDGSLGSSVQNGTGVQTFWNPSGHKEWELELRDAKREHLRTWHENGQLSLDQSYHDGLPEGPYLRFHSNGKKAGTGFNSNGRPSGQWTYWNEDGQLTEESEFQNGEYVWNKVYEYENSELRSVRYSRRLEGRSELYDGLSLVRIEYYTSGQVSRIEHYDADEELSRVENLDSPSTSEPAGVTVEEAGIEPVSK